MSFLLALSLTLSVFSMGQVSAHMDVYDSPSQITESSENHKTSNHESTKSFHIEKCGIASCAIAFPDFFTYSSTEFGKKVPFEVTSSRVASLGYLPPHRPPKK